MGEVCVSTSSNITFKNIQDKKGDYPIYGASGVVAYVDFYTKENESLGIVKDGAGIGRVFLLPPKASVIGTLHYIENGYDLNLKYLFYFLQSINLARYITGSAIPHIYFRDWKKEQIPLPPLEFQKRIVARLDEAFVRIDNGTKHLKTAKANLTKYKQSLLKSAFEGTLFCHTEQSEVSQTLESIHFTHAKAPSAREGEQDGCHEFKSPLPCGVDLGVGVIANEQSECGNLQNKTIDCHESASLRFADSRNDDKISLSRAESIPLPQGEGLTFDTPSLADSAFSCPPSPVDDNFTHSTSLAKCRPTISPSRAKSHLCSPSLAEGARGWVDSHNNTTHCHTEALQKAEVSQKSTNRDSSLTAFAQNDNKGNHRDISLSAKAQYDNNGETPNLPQGWTIKTLGEAAQTTSGGTPSRKNLDFWNGNIKWLKSGELNDSYIDEVEETITQSGLKKSSAKIFSKGTLLIALYGATIGKLGILNLETSTNQAVCAIVPNNELDTKYLFHFLFSIRSKMIKDAFGGAQSNISQTYLKQIKIPLPPLEIQKQIVEILEKHFSSADKTSAFIDSALKNAKQLKSSLLKSSFTGKLV